MKKFIADKLRSLANRIDSPEMFTQINAGGYVGDHDQLASEIARKIEKKFYQSRRI